jgi:hypothetical protein
MANVAIQIFTFTSTESDAVDQLFDTMTNATPTTWSQTGVRVISSPRQRSLGTAVVTHTPLSAQGNVIAGTALARAFTEASADYYIFYGCCGTVHKSNVGNVFRVATVSYISLGAVRPATAPDEMVKLKNKWIVNTGTPGDLPLPPVVLPAGAPGQPGTLDGLGIGDAVVLATDKVIHVPPAAKVPAPVPPGGNVFPKEEWTYAESLAHHVNAAIGSVVLIDMESFGIASTAIALGCDLRVLILRVPTDTLGDKKGQTDAQQLALLVGGHPALLDVLARIMDP